LRVLGVFFLFGAELEDELEEPLLESELDEPEELEEPEDDEEPEEDEDDEEDDLGFLRLGVALGAALGEGRDMGLLICDKGLSSSESLALVGLI
jgi:hypothetical protein